MAKYSVKYLVGFCSLALVLGTHSLALDTGDPSRNLTRPSMYITPELIREAEARGQQCKLRYIPGSDVVVAIYSQGDNDGTTTKSRRGKVDHMEPDPSLGPPPELIWEAEHAPGVLRYNSDEDQYYIDRSPNPNPDPIVKSPDDL